MIFLKGAEENRDVVNRSGAFYFNGATEVVL